MVPLGYIIVFVRLYYLADWGSMMEGFSMQKSREFRESTVAVCPIQSTCTWSRELSQGLVNVPIEHHPTIGDVNSNRCLKVMFRIP